MKRTVTAILLAAVILAAFAACGGSPAEIEAPATTALAPVTVTLLVTLPDGTQNTHEIISDKATLGEALDDEGLVERDATGMVVKVDGIEAIWDNDKAYWSFEINGDYAMHGVDEEILTPGNTYELKYTKG